LRGRPQGGAQLARVQVPGDCDEAETPCSSRSFSFHCLSMPRSDTPALPSHRSPSCPETCTLRRTRRCALFSSSSFPPSFFHFRLSVHLRLPLQFYSKKKTEPELDPKYMLQSTLPSLSFHSLEPILTASLSTRSHLLRHRQHSSSPSRHLARLAPRRKEAQGAFPTLLLFSTFVLPSSLFPSSVTDFPPLPLPQSQTLHHADTEEELIPLFHEDTDGSKPKSHTVMGRRNYAMADFDEQTDEIVFKVCVEKSQGSGTTRECVLSFLSCSEKLTPPPSQVRRPRSRSSLVIPLPTPSQLVPPFFPFDSLILPPLTRPQSRIPVFLLGALMYTASGNSRLVSRYVVVVSLGVVMREEESAAFSSFPFSCFRRSTLLSCDWSTHRVCRFSRFEEQHSRFVQWSLPLGEDALSPLLSSLSLSFTSLASANTPLDWQT
jgi:hypothetical protein